MKKQKLALILQISILILIVVTFILWFANSQGKAGTGSEIAIPIVMVLIVALMIPFVIRNFKSIKEGMPAADERSTKAAHQAGYYAFLISIYILLAFGWFGDDWFERPSQATGAAILVMAVVFIGLWLTFERRGKL